MKQLILTFPQVVTPEGDLDPSVVQYIKAHENVSLAGRMDTLTLVSENGETATVRVLERGERQIVLINKRAPNWVHEAVLNLKKTNRLER